jgi:hypothetical protein
MSRTGHRTYRRRRQQLLATTDVCAWCGRWLDPDVKWPHPHSATVDHVRPVSRGGDNTRGELVAACWGCNRSRGNRLGPPRPKRKKPGQRSLPQDPPRREHVAVGKQKCWSGCGCPCGSSAVAPVVPGCLAASEARERGLNALRNALKVGSLNHEIDREGCSVMGRSVERT